MLPRAWILWSWSFLWLWKVGQERLVGIAIDAQQEPVATEADKRSYSLALELDAESFVLVRLTIRLKRDALQVPLYAFLCRNVLQTQIAVGIFVEIARLGGCLFCNDGNAESCSRQIIGDAFEGAARNERFNFCLCRQTDCCKTEYQG